MRVLDSKGASLPFFSRTVPESDPQTMSIRISFLFEQGSEVHTQSDRQQRTHKAILQTDSKHGLVLVERDGQNLPYMRRLNLGSCIHFGMTNGPWLSPWN